MSSKSQVGLIELDFRIDYLSAFLDSLSKLEHRIIFPKGFDDRSQTIHQIEINSENEPILSFWLNNYKITFGSRIRGISFGNEKYKYDGIKLNIEEDLWIDIEKNKGKMQIDEIIELQVFFQRFVAFGSKYSNLY